MKLKSFAGDPAIRSRTRGYTFTEVLIVLGIVAALAIGAFVLFTQRGTSTEMGQVAQQIGETISSQQRMIASGMRGGQVSPRELASSIGNMLSTHKFITGGGTAPSPVAVQVGGTVPTSVGSGALTGANVCSGSGADGFAIYLAFGGTPELDLQELTELQSQIIAAIKNPFNNAPPGGSFVQVMDTAGTADLAGLDRSEAPIIGTATAPSQLFICFE